MTSLVVNGEKVRMVNVDFDKTLTDPDQDEWSPAYQQTPNPEMVEYVQKLYFSGHIVNIWTARQWTEASGVAGWLTAHEVPFHGLRCGKGGSDMYIDDKAVRPDEALEGDEPSRS